MNEEEDPIKKDGTRCVCEKLEKGKGKEGRRVASRGHLYPLKVDMLVLGLISVVGFLNVYAGLGAGGFGVRETEERRHREVSWCVMSKFWMTERRREPF